MAFLAYNHGMGLNESRTSLSEGWQLSTFRKLQHLRVYGSPQVVEAAGRAYTQAWKWGLYSDFGQADDEFYKRQDLYNEAESDLLLAIRSDLGVQVWEVDDEPG